jgi:transketolase
MTTAATADLAPPADDVDGRAVVTIRMLAADAVEAAACGHPGLPMGAATMAYVLWSRFLRHDPSRPDWPDRDRFVLSAGHGSALLYALHLFGYDVSLDDLRAFRQWGSRTPGHPEFGHTPGVETTTGPLGQGLGNAVGMALAERMLAARYNRPGHDIVDHRTFVLFSDGDLMEGVSHEAASLAGHLGLGRLVVLYDDNQVTIDGPTGLSFSEDVPNRFAAYGWHTQRVDDGNDAEAVATALAEAIAEQSRPSLIAVRTVIGYGAPTKAGTPDAHGAALGASELIGAKIRVSWPLDSPFFVPTDVRGHFKGLAEEGSQQHRRWAQRSVSWAETWPELAAEWERTQARRLPEGWSDALAHIATAKPIATRVASGAALQAFAERLPELVGGSADLASSTNTALPGGSVVAGDYRGRTIHFGVREHAMAAVLNGIALHRGLRAFGSTFLVFSDYLRPALRLAALAGLPVVYVFTHDSIGLGEDGPTHQPVEHLAALRAIPGLAVLRPADACETAEAWRVAIERTNGPTALILSRQALPVLAPCAVSWLAKKGARVVFPGRPSPSLVLVATGSEVSLAREAAALLADEHGIDAGVVSMAWRERFAALPRSEQDALLPPGVPRLVIEAASPQGWEGVAGDTGRVLGLERFGASAPGSVVMAELGFNPERVAAAALRLLGRSARPATVPIGPAGTTEG